MGQDLLKRREQVMEQANRVLDAAWPERKGEDFVRQSRWAAKELEAIASEMRTKGLHRVEQSRTYRFLGGVYADLEPALGVEMLLKAKEAYQTAEILLEGQSDELERAKLNFNFANTLRQIDRNDIQQLQDAKRRLLAAHQSFATYAPQYLSQVDAALMSVENLMKLAPLATAVQQNTADMAKLEKKMAQGGNVSEIAEEAREIMKRGGGVAGLTGQLKDIVEGLPPDLKKDEKFSSIEQQTEALINQVLNKGGPGKEEGQILNLLRERVKSEIQGGKVTGDRAETIHGMLDQLVTVLSGDEGDVPTMLAKAQKMRELAESSVEVLHYLSHDIDRPPGGSRAADLVELNWQLRRYLHEEMNRSGRGEEESKEALDLSVRATRVDKRIYEAGDDDARAFIVDREELRPLALAVRGFSARMHSMRARPIWQSAKVSVDSSAVFYSGAAGLDPRVSAACHQLRLELMPEPRGESFANARWKQLQKAATTIFDLRGEGDPLQAAVTYELGIALTLGKPVVVVVDGDQTMPFDVDIDPVFLRGGAGDEAKLMSAIDQSLVWVYPRPRSEPYRDTLEYILSKYPRPHQNVLVDQTLRVLSDLRKDPDPLAITRTLSKFFDFLGDGDSMLIQPLWPPAYPNAADLRLFHVMPFRPQWANDVTNIVRYTCKAAGVQYIRGDEVDEPNVIRSIWDEIARSTHVLVDLTGFNANVALELGITHTLGRKTLMVGQGNTVDHLFPSIRKMRVYKYDVTQLEQTIGSAVKKFLSS